jgi:UDP-N-acetylglucosamine 2-epimerase
VTIRGETEWTETLACGANALVPALDAPRLLSDTVAAQRRNAKSAPWTPDAYGDGRAAERIREAIAGLLAHDPG